MNAMSITYGAGKRELRIGAERFDLNALANEVGEANMVRRIKELILRYRRA